MDHIVKRTQKVDEDQAGKRLDIFISDWLGVSRSQAVKYIKHKTVEVDGSIIKKGGVTVQVGQEVVVERSTLVQEHVRRATDEEKALLDQVEVIHNTRDYVVINKPCGLITHPRTNIDTKEEVAQTVTVSGWAVQHYKKVWGVGEYANRPGVVHRLDAATSGLMVIAKTQKAFEHLKEQFKSRQIKKKYFALVHGVIEEEHGVLDFDIAMGKEGKMVARPKSKDVTLKNITRIQDDGKNAYTDFSVLERFARYTFVEARPKTGRTHQIRVHFYAFNHPLCGDGLYKNKRLIKQRDLELERMFLHSHYLSFTDLKGEVVEFESDLPEVLQEYKKSLT